VIPQLFARLELAEARQAVTPAHPGA
jgi:hypothetical protein